jgi:hypothetical protein
VPCSVVRKNVKEDEKDEKDVLEFQEKLRERAPREQRMMLLHFLQSVSCFDDALLQYPKGVDSLNLLDTLKEHEYPVLCCQIYVVSSFLEKTALLLTDWKLENMVLIRTKGRWHLISQNYLAYTDAQGKKRMRWVKV